MSRKHLSVPLSVLAVLALGAPSFGVVFNDPPNVDAIIETARARQTEIMNSSNTILATAEAENHRDLTTEERTEVDNLAAEFDRLEDDIKRREGIAARNALLTTPRNRQTEPDPVEPVEAANDGRPQNQGQRRRRVLRPLLASRPAATAVSAISATSPTPSAWAPCAAAKWTPGCATQRSRPIPVKAPAPMAASRSRPTSALRS
jgi:TolA-binding protein